MPCDTSSAVTCASWSCACDAPMEVTEQDRRADLRRDRELAVTYQRPGRLCDSRSGVTCPARGGWCDRWPGVTFKLRSPSLASSFPFPFLLLLLTVLLHPLHIL